MRQKVIAVVPTYNSSELVLKRVKELQKNSFGKIVVCDDASSDNTAEQLRNEFDSQALVIRGTKNLGPGGNRNRIIPRLSGDGIIFFLDADCQFIYKKDIVELIRKIFSDKSVGVVGFSINDAKNKPMRWNYGELMHPVREAPDQVLEHMLEHGEITKGQFIKGAPARAASYRMLPEKELQQVGWVAEGCFAIRASLFRKIKGFDTAMRYHETHDLNVRIQKQGYKTVFCSTTVAKHLEHDSRLSRRKSDIRSARLHYYKKHWSGMTENVFKHMFNEKSDH